MHNNKTTNTLNKRFIFKNREKTVNKKYSNIFYVMTKLSFDIHYVKKNRVLISDDFKLDL